MQDTNPLTDLAISGYDCKHVVVNLLGVDGNIFVVMGMVNRAMRRAKVPLLVREAFAKDIMASDDYDEALQRVMKWVTVTAEKTCGCDC